MSKTCPETLELLADLWDQTLSALQRLTLIELPIEESFALAHSEDRRVRLQAAHWQLGADREPLGECRMVLLQGVSSTIVNVLIFPASPAKLPLFVAEVLAFGGCPRLAFFDLQDLGLQPNNRAEIAAGTIELAKGCPALERAVDVPEWAIKPSLGGFFFTRSTDKRCTEDIADMYSRYLEHWIQIAEDQTNGSANPVGASEDATLSFKQEHLAHWPGTEYLARMFGAEWARRFLHSFLYR